MFSLDLSILQAIQSIAAPWLTWVMRAVSNLFLPEIVLPVVGGILLFFLIKHRRAQEALLLLILAGNVLTLIMKPIIQRPRPTISQAVVYDHPKNYSLPSGHAVAAMTVGGAVILLLHHRRQPPMALTILVASLIGLIGFSRVYLGAHWPSDVLAGWLVGWLWLVFVWRVIRPPVERRWPASRKVPE